MTFTIVYPQNAHSAYKIAAEAFASLAKEVSNAETLLITDASLLPDDSTPIIAIGSDSVNHLVANLYLERKIDDLGICYGTDNYRIFSQNIDGRDYVFLAGGRPRATIYAVYRYFEKFCGCRWFWDGDRIPHATMPFENLDITESPRFEYRGLRYFAHRSLHRFQAEHWSLEDWQQEIDWMLKKRLNLFMLRIGLDDVFQKAFPDIVPYPELDKPLPEAGDHFNDRSLFWSLQYRGELRKMILKYAFERDLMHPEDCGTITHWYSRTPRAYLDAVKPKLLCCDQYSDATGQTWDVLDDESLENYFKLTETHIQEYGKAELFHTIGLAERFYSPDREVNMRLKLYVYRRVSEFLKKKYPNAPLLIATWDIWLLYTSEEARRLISELDPKQAIIFDYTSDTKSSANFTTWGVVNKFPWVFGMFGGYEPDNDIRGFYDWTNERIKIAKDDPMCKGVILWPELSHGDTFMTEYLSYNAWNKETEPIETLLDRFCSDRYSLNNSEKMRSIWADFMPIVQMRSWNPDDSSHMYWGQNTFVWLEKRATFSGGEYKYCGRDPEDGAKNQDNAVKVLRALSEIAPDDEMLSRDVCDIARTVLGRYIDCAIRLAELRYLSCDDRMEDSMKSAMALLKLLGELLATHEDYSLLASLERLRSVTETNPNFEVTLKRNSSGSYCRSFISEHATYLYVPELEIIFDEVKKSAELGCDIDRKAISERIKKNMARFFEIPLSDMKCGNGRCVYDILIDSADVIEKMVFF